MHVFVHFIAKKRHFLPETETRGLNQCKTHKGWKFSRGSTP